MCAIFVYNSKSFHWKTEAQRCSYRKTLRRHLYRRGNAWTCKSTNSGNRVGVAFAIQQSVNCTQLNLAVPHKSLEMPGSSTDASSHYVPDYKECLSELGGCSRWNVSISSRFLQIKVLWTSLSNFSEAKYGLPQTFWTILDRAIAKGCSVRLSVCPSVRPSRSWSTAKRFKLTKYVSCCMFVVVRCQIVLSWV